MRSKTKNSKKSSRKSSNKYDLTANKQPAKVDKKTIKSRFSGFFSQLNDRRKDFLSRRPHRSFQRTRRRDYARSMKLPGYFALTNQALKLISSNKRIFFGIVFIFAALTVLSASIMSEDSYRGLRDVVEGASDEGQFVEIVPILGLFWGVFTSQVTGVSFGSPGSAQQAIGVMFALFAWLSTVWLARAIMTGKNPRIRDGIYASGGPVIALILLALVLLIQCVPAVLALVAYSSASATGLLDQTVVLMLFGGGAIALVTLSLYWIVSTLIAMVIVTIPGMYPMKALRLAGDLVIGRRTRIVLRTIWLLVGLFLFWAVVLIPTILIDSALKSSFPVIEWLPIVPVIALLLMAFSIVFSAIYVYTLYRKVVADEAPPA